MIRNFATITSADPAASPAAGSNVPSGNPPASPAPATGTGGAGSGSGSPAAAAPSQGQPGVPPASPSGQPNTPGNGQPPTGSPNDENIATLRTNYERFRKLGEPDVVERTSKHGTAVFGRAQQLATALNYTPDSLQAAFDADPVGTLMQLEREAATAQAANPEDKDLDTLVSEKLAPIQSYVAQQQADAANTKFTTEFDRLLTTHDLFKGATDVPKEVRDVLYDMVSESFKYDKQALSQLVREGKMSGVQKYFDGVMERFQKVVNSYNSWQSKRGNPNQPTTTAPAGDGKPAFNLQDIIEGNDNAVAAMPSLRRSG